MTTIVVGGFMAVIGLAGAAGMLSRAWSLPSEWAPTRAHRVGSAGLGMAGVGMATAALLDPSRSDLYLIGGALSAVLLVGVSSYRLPKRAGTGPNPQQGTSVITIERFVADRCLLVSHARTP